MHYTAHAASPLGRLALASDGKALTGLWLEGQRYYAAGLTAGAAPEEGLPIFDAVRRWLERYFAGQRPSPGELPLATVGSPFRQVVWGLLREIPWGRTTTYAALAAQTARRLGRERMSARAIGSAVAHNPISIVIPCHRVVGSDGGLTGYAGGVERKLWLLQHEGADIAEPHRYTDIDRRRTP